MCSGQNGIHGVQGMVNRVSWTECSGQSQIHGVQIMVEIMGQRVYSVCGQNGTDVVKSMVDKMG